MQRYSSGPYIFKNDDLSVTNSILMETPLFKNLFMQNQELEEQVQMLKHNIMYFESTNKKLMRKVNKLERKIESHKKKKMPIRQVVEERIVKENNEDGVEETKEEDDEVVVVETEEEDDEVVVVETEEEDDEVVVVETEVEEDEVVVVETEEEDDEVVVVETEEEEDEVVVVETEEEEDEVVVVETEEEEEEEGAEEDVYEIEINGKTYYVSNEKDSVIYAADENGDISIEAGVYKNGKPIFN